MTAVPKGLIRNVLDPKDGIGRADSCFESLWERQWQGKQKPRRGLPEESAPSDVFCPETHWTLPNKILATDHPDGNILD